MRYNINLKYICVIIICYIHMYYVFFNSYVLLFYSSVEQPENSTILPAIYPVLNEHETASIESSSSDIDIIDENMEDSVSGSFLHPLSLSISSSIGKLYFEKCFCVLLIVFNSGIKKKS